MFPSSVQRLELLSLLKKVGVNEKWIVKFLILYLLFFVALMLRPNRKHFLDKEMVKFGWTTFAAQIMTPIYLIAHRIDLVFTTVGTTRMQGSCVIFLRVRFTLVHVCMILTIIFIIRTNSFYERNIRWYQRIKYCLNSHVSF